MTTNRLLVAGLFWLWTLPALAQVSPPTVHPSDPRPLKSLDRAKLPAVESFDAIKHRAIPGGALRSSQYVGRSEIVQLSVVNKGESPVGTGAPNERSIWRILRAPNGTVNWMWRLSSSSTVPHTMSLTSPTKALDELGQILRIQHPSQEFTIRRDETDEKGLRHVHFDQQYQGISVWKREIAIHYDATGEIATINGTYVPTPDSMDVRPSLAPDVAIAKIVARTKDEGEWAGDDAQTMARLCIEGPKATLALYPDGRTFRLVYDVDIHPNILHHYIYLVDAHTGDLVKRLADHCSLIAESHQVIAPRISGFAMPASTSGKGMHTLSGFAAASGSDLNNVTQNFRTYLNSDNSYYMLWDLANFNAGKSNLPNEMSGGCMTIDLRNKDAIRGAELFQVTSSNNSWSDKAAISAHTNMNVCYQYYKNTFTRKAIDGADASIVSVIHVTDNSRGMENAYWNGTMMLYGDGQTVFKPLAGGLDVAAHEMTHGVTGHSADLLYETQSGALNESFSDVFGILVDTRNYLIGEDVMKPGQGTCLRNMENPADPNAGSQQPSTMADFRNLSADQDNGGVHINSGIPNHAAVLVMKDLGREKTQRIYYLALTKYLTRSSQFIDCRLACEAAADEIFGKGSNETKSVSSAFAAVGIGGSASNSGGNDVPPQTGGTDYVVFMTADGSIGVLQPGSQNAAMFTSSAAVARVNTTNAGIDRCQLSAPTSGKDIWFVSQSGQLSFIESATGAVSNFPNLMIQQSGDVWNASVSPDESYVTLASAYQNDPNIYIFDGQQIARIELTPETQDGGARQTIQYPDVMNWSPNKKEPRIAFDAYNEDSFAGSTISYWSMYEVNFSTGKIYNLIPTQPADISIGNVSYSKTNPDVIAFNMVGTAASDVVVTSFENNAFLPLDIPSHLINNQNILDADRPTFSPNDRYLAFSSAANNAILFFDGSNSSLSFLAFQSALYNPYWMLVGGTEGVSVNPSQTITGVEARPSITTGRSQICFETKQAGRITIEILNVLGEVARSFAGREATVGAQTSDIDLTGLPAGSYLVRVTNGQSVAIGRIVLE